MLYVVGQPDLSFAIGGIPSELSLDRHWELMEHGRLKDVVLEVERLGVAGRIGGGFWVELAVAADDLGMKEEAARYLWRSETRVRDW